jgi:hypothetical protein
MKKINFTLFGVYLTIFAQLAQAGLPPTTSKGVGDSTNLTTFNYQFPNFAITHTGTTMSLGVLGLAGGGTNKTSVTTTATASSWAGWDSNINLSASAFIPKRTSTATAAGTTTLTVSSPEFQQFTGSTTQTVVLPDATTCSTGQTYFITNRSTGIVTVNANGGTLVQTLVPGSQTILTLITNTPAAGVWDSQYTITALTATVPPTVQKFLSGSGTYTTPTGVNFIRVKAVGAGGGGGGSGNATTGTAGSAGGATTFGTSLLSAGGGAGGTASTGLPGAGGTASLGTGPIGTAVNGTSGMQGSQGQAQTGGSGANAPSFSGAGPGGQMLAVGIAGLANTGGGGGGGGGPALSGNSGNGGSSGALVDALITSPLSTYAYAVGTGGGGGTAGTNGGSGNGGTGGSGYLEVTEYYTNLAVGTTTSVAANTYFGGPYSGSSANPTFKTFRAPTVQVFTSTGTTTGYQFIVSSANATVGATYTNNGNTYTVVNTIAAGTQLFASQASAPLSSGTLTKASGTGDATITFSSATPYGSYTPTAGAIYAHIRMSAGGGGGSGSATVAGSNGGTGGSGKLSVFGANMILANGGVGGAGGSLGSGAAGGTASFSGVSGFTINGGGGQGGGYNTQSIGGMGGANAFGGSGYSVSVSAAGLGGAANTGAGGGGGGAGTSTSIGGGGGGAGGYVDVILSTLSGTYPYIVGTGGAGGAAGASGQTGGAGANGMIDVIEYYQ